MLNSFFWVPFVIWWHNQHQSYPLRPWLYHVRFPNWTDLEKEEPNLVKVKLPSVVSQLSFFCSFFVLYGIHVCILAPILIIDTLMWGPGLLYFCTSSTRCSQTCLDAEVAPQCTANAPCSALHTSAALHTYKRYPCLYKHCTVLFNSMQLQLQCD